MYSSKNTASRFIKDVLTIKHTFTRVTTNTPAIYYRRLTNLVWKLIYASFSIFSVCLGAVLLLALSWTLRKELLIASKLKILSQTIK